MPGSIVSLGRVWEGETCDFERSDYVIRVSKTRTEVLADSRKKGVQTAVLTTATVAAGVLHAPLVLVGVLAVPTVLAGLRWWKHRAENGIRF